MTGCDVDLDAFFVVLIHTSVYNYFYMISGIFLLLLIPSSKTAVALPTEVVRRAVLTCALGRFIRLNRLTLDRNTKYFARTLVSQHVFGDYDCYSVVWL